MKAAKTILFILICIAMIWLIIVLLGKAFSPKDKTPDTPPIPLASYATTDTQTSMYVDGPVEANQIHEAMRITVDRNQVLVERISGYENNVVGSRSFANNSNSYAAFLEALDKAQFDAPISTKYPKDERGFCALRTRTVYRMNVGSEDVVHAWTTPCSGVGNFTGSSATVKRLFLNQVPNTDMRELMKGSRLSYSS